MPVKLDKKIFTYLIGAMIIIIVLTAGIAVFAALGGMDMLRPADDPTPTWEQNIEEEGPWGDKLYTWEYDGETLSASVYIIKDVYNEFNYGISGTVYPDNISEYAVTYADGNVVSMIAGQLENIASRKGYITDEEKVNLVLSFAASFPYETDRETGRTASYPRAPIVTLGDETGDSGDHAILAAALLKELGYGTALIYYPPAYDRLSIIPSAVAFGLITNDTSHTPVYGVTTETGEVVPFAAFWAVDTNEKDVPRFAYDGITPHVYPVEGFSEGRNYSTESFLTFDLASAMKLKVSNDAPFTPKNWQQEMAEYYADDWYPANIFWSMDDNWRLYENFVSIADVPAALYTPWGTAEYNAVVPWRISYTVTGMDQDNIYEMTPYSDVRIVLYRIDSSGTATLVKTFGWQGLYSGDLYKTEGPFSSGTYAIGVFVRNAEVDISLEYHGKPDFAFYEGGI